MTFAFGEFRAEKKLMVRWDGSDCQRHQTSMHDKERPIKAPKHEHLEATGGHYDLNPTEDHNVDPSIEYSFS